jgi:hypothetical protein
VQQRLAVIEEPKRMNPLNVNVTETAREVLDGYRPYLGFEGRIRAAEASELSAMDDIKVNGKEVFWGLHHLSNKSIYSHGPICG